MSTSRRTFWAVAVAGVVVIVLAGVSVVAFGAVSGGFHHGWSAPNGQCTAPKLSGSVVDVTLSNMRGGAMMQDASGGGMMRVLSNKAQVAAGTVSFRVANTGNLVHELVVLPLRPGQQPGNRTVGNGNRVSETGSFGEASSSCAAGPGDGINPGTIGWVTLHLSPGSYELVCNLAGHYAAGMYTRLTVL